MPFIKVQTARQSVPVRSKISKIYLRVQSHQREAIIESIYFCLNIEKIALTPPPHGILNTSEELEKKNLISKQQKSGL